MSQPDDPGLAARVVALMMSKDAFSQWLGIEVLEARPRGSTVRMRVRTEMVNGFGVAHGGIVFSLADSALAFASNTHGRVTLAVENSISYPAPINVGDVLTAVAVEESGTNRLAFYRVTVTNERDAIVALFKGTVYKTTQEHFPDMARS
jgi:acyl-CoA thioesterase